MAHVPLGQHRHPGDEGKVDREHQELHQQPVATEAAPYRWRAEGDHRRSQVGGEEPEHGDAQGVERQRGADAVEQPGAPGGARLTPTSRGGVGIARQQHQAPQTDEDHGGDQGVGAGFLAVLHLERRQGQQHRGEEAAAPVAEGAADQEQGGAGGGTEHGGGQAHDALVEPERHEPRRDHEVERQVVERQAVLHQGGKAERRAAQGGDLVHPVRLAVDAVQAGGQRHQDDDGERNGEAGDAVGAACRLVGTTRVAAGARVGVVS